METDLNISGNENYNVFFSFIIPVYNLSEYLRQCIESILNQSFKNFEIICVDDSSDDNSLDILKEYALKDNRIVVISQNKQGQGFARNNAIKLAKGKYIVFVDGDDWIENDYLSSLYNILKENEEEIIEFNYREYNENSKTFKNISTASYFNKVLNFDLNRNNCYSYRLLDKTFLSKIFLQVWNRVYLRDFLIKNNIEFSLNCFGEDHIFTIMSVLSAKSIYYIDKYLYNYRLRMKSSVNSFNIGNFCIFDNILCVEAYLKNTGLLEELQEGFNRYKINSFAMHYKNIPADKKEEYKLKCREYLSDSDYKNFISIISKKMSFLEQIFSVKNEYNFINVNKVITILGFKIRPKDLFGYLLGGGKREE